MESKLYLLATLFCTWVLMVSSQATGGPPTSYPCIQKLLPCQPYIKAPSPPPTCCAPLKALVQDQKQKDCLCSLFNNQGFLKSINVTKEEALALPKACGINVNIYSCTNAVPAPTTSPTSPSPPPASPEGSSNSSDTPKSSATRQFMGGFSFISLFLALLLCTLAI